MLVSTFRLGSECEASLAWGSGAAGRARVVHGPCGPGGNMCLSSRFVEPSWPWADEESQFLFLCGWCAFQLLRAVLAVAVDTS